MRRLGLAVAAVALLAAAVALLAAAADAAPITPPPNVDVSRAIGTQSEVSIAADPRNANVLLAGSNDYTLATERVYSSTDGGSTWTSEPGPPRVKGLPGDASDPVVGIDEHGRQYFGFIQVTGSDEQGTGRSWLVVSSRDGPHGTWHSTAVPGANGADKPSLAVSGRRVYVAWTREGDWIRPTTPLNDILLASSADGGRTWSRPVRLNAISSLFLSYSSIAVDGRTVYAAWLDTGLIEVAHGRGGRFSAEQVVGAPGGGGCAPAIPAQPRHCVRPNPVIVADPARGRVYVTWSQLARNGSLDVDVARLGGAPHQVNPPDGRRVSDQFWPAPAVDSRTGRLWVCFYDTRADPARKQTRFSCTVSADGAATWARPQAVASAPSDETRSTLRRPYGDYEGLTVAGGVAHPIWTDARDVGKRDEEIYTARVTAARFSGTP